MSAGKRFASNNGGRVAFVSGCRTPFARAGGKLADLTALDLSRGVVREIIDRTALDEKLVERAIMGVVVPDIKAPNLAREAVLAAGLPPSIEAYTVSWASAWSSKSNEEQSCQPECGIF
jgi:acetyl-CoA acetyltransferase